MFIPTHLSKMTDEELLDYLMSASDYEEKIIRKMLSQRNGLEE